MTELWSSKLYSSKVSKIFKGDQSVKLAESDQRDQMYQSVQIHQSYQGKP